MVLKDLPHGPCVLRLSRRPVPRTTIGRNNRPPIALQYIRPKNIEAQPEIFCLLTPCRLESSSGLFLDVCVCISTGARTISPIGEGHLGILTPPKKKAAGVGQEDSELGVVVMGKVADCFV